MGSDPDTGIVRLVRNENYWNKAALQSAGSFGIQELELHYINGSSAALEALKVGSCPDKSIIHLLMLIFFSIRS
jgi:hypothetical protein